MLWFGLIRFRFWLWLSNFIAPPDSPSRDLLTDIIVNRLESAKRCIEEHRHPRWKVCPEFGGSNLEVNGPRTKALNYVAQLGAVRHVDDHYGVIIYTPNGK